MMTPGAMVLLVVTRGILVLRAFWKCVPEHGPLAYRLFFRCFMLNDVPMLDKDSVLNAHDICGNPVHREAEVRKSPVHDHEVSLGHNHSRFILQRWRKALDEIEQALTTGSDMRAVLDVVWRPKLLGSPVVTLVEYDIERCQDKSFVFRLNCTIHCLISPPPTACIHRPRRDWHR